MHGGWAEVEKQLITAPPHKLIALLLSQMQSSKNLGS
jgi:hypothetical protein